MRSAYRFFEKKNPLEVVCEKPVCQQWETAEVMAIISHKDS